MRLNSRKFGWGYAVMMTRRAMHGMAGNSDARTHGKRGRTERYRGHPGRKAAIWQICKRKRRERNFGSVPFLFLSLSLSFGHFRYCAVVFRRVVGGFFVISYIMTARFIPRREQTSFFFLFPFFFPRSCYGSSLIMGFGLAQLARSIAPMLACMYHEIERVNESVSGDR